jgi:hypothetical protein
MRHDFIPSVAKSPQIAAPITDLVRSSPGERADEGAQKPFGAPETGLCLDPAAETEIEHGRR